MSIPDDPNQSVSAFFQLTGTEPLEEVLVDLDITHKYRGDLEAYLISPSGTSSRLMIFEANDSGDDIQWTFCTNAFWGEIPAGTWELRVQDVLSLFKGTWNSYKVTARMGRLIPAPSQPPAVLTASSSKLHGPDPIAIDVSTPSAVEPRIGGVTELAVTFDKPVQSLTGTVNDVQVSQGAVQSLFVQGATVTIQLAGAAGPGPLTVAFPGIADAADGSAVVADTLCFGVLLGDVNADRVVNILDLVAVRNNLGTSVQPGNAETDVNADRSINIFDLVLVRNSLNTTAAACP